MIKINQTLRTKSNPPMFEVSWENEDLRSVDSRINGTPGSFQTASRNVVDNIVMGATRRNVTITKQGW